MSVGQSYKRQNIEEHWDSIVIGSGIGGLCAAALLARHGGQRVLVLERHYEAGGFTHVFHRPGYEWDVGVHYIGEVNSPHGSVRRIFDHVTDGRLDWTPMPDVYDRIVIGDRHYDFPSGVERFRERMKSYFPTEGGAIDRYIAAVLSAVRAVPMFMAEKAIPAPLARLVGGFMRRPLMKWARQTTAQVLGTLTSNRELIAVLTGQWGDYGLPPTQSSFAAHAVVAAHYLDGAGFPVGGAGAIAAGIAPLIEAVGGRILVKAEVASILLEKDRAVGVRMADGRELRARSVVSDAGAYNTFMRLLPADLAAGQTVRDTLRRLPSSMAHLCLYVGVKRAAGEAEFDATNLWVYNDADYEVALERFNQNPAADLPLLFISFPSAKDPTFETRYPARSTIEVVAPVPYAMFERWEETRWKKRGEEYDAFKARLQARLVEGLERHVPSVRGRVDFHEMSTPLSTRHFANQARGEIYGLVQTPERFAARELGARTPIRGLYLTGADTCVSGVSGALMGGVLTASAMLGRNLTSVVSRGAGRRAVASPAELVTT